MFCAVELHVTRINLLPNARGLFASSKAIIVHARLPCAMSKYS